MSVGFGMVLGTGGCWWGAGGTGGGGSAPKSAVQLLQESKGRYVKSGRVLESRQAPSRPDRLHISANPNIFLSAPAHTLHPQPTKDAALIDCAPLPVVPQKKSPVPPPIPPRNAAPVAPLTAVALALHSGVSPINIVIPRGAPRPRAKTQPVSDAARGSAELRRSQSQGRADRINVMDVQMKLRRLLNTDSHESLLPDSSALDTPDGCATNGTCGTFRAEVVSVSSHKSLPEIRRMINSNLSDSARRPSCPGAIIADCAPRPPPRLPRRFRAAPPRPPPPKLPWRAHNGGFVNGLSPLSPPVMQVINATFGNHVSEATTPVVEEVPRRPILRSKSDVSHERPLGAGSSTWGDCDGFAERTSPFDPTELASFFECMGLDGATLRAVGLAGSPSRTASSGDASPPIYFEERSSEESGAFGRRESDDSDDLLPTRGAVILNKVKTPLGRRPGEPSIVEKNARVIKWLFICQRAAAAASGMSSSATTPLLPRSQSSSGS